MPSAMKSALMVLLGLSSLAAAKPASTTKAVLTRTTRTATTKTCSAKTVTETQTLYPPCAPPQCDPWYVEASTVYETVTVTPTPGPCSTLSTSSISTPTITASPGQPTSWGPLCPQYCARTTTVPPVKECLMQPAVCLGEPQTTTLTNYQYCRWCPTMSCASIKVYTATATCPGLRCDITETAEASCALSTKPPGYTITIG